MSTLMRRRQMMIQEKAASGALYPMADRTINLGTSQSVGLVSDGNHIEVTTGGNSRKCYMARMAACKATYIDSSWPVWFHLNAGDVCDMYLKNFSLGRQYCYVTFRDASDTAIVGVGQVNSSLSGTDVHYQTIMETDCDITALMTQVYRASDLTFDIELYVNGIRYV